jgi:hypothetical protein
VPPAPGKKERSMNIPRVVGMALLAALFVVLVVTATKG